MLSSDTLEPTFSVFARQQCLSNRSKSLLRSVPTSRFEQSGGQTFWKRGEVGEELEGEVGETDKSETFPVREEEKQVPATTSLEYKAAASRSKSKS